MASIAKMHHLQSPGKRPASVGPAEEIVTGGASILLLRRPTHDYASGIQFGDHGCASPTRLASPLLAAPPAPSVDAD
ncbi:hypothetical protein QIS74_11198 [Colletotrichum tabaci]|uniref:Uncharacterized protein n=1 Tax=Colletotrichum tabaci TaxID=1209068 RepID=A0AAV9SXQ0_9PEZI